MKIGLGMDTGGTYADAVVMDLDSGEILSKAKSMTTREDLRIGIRGAIEALDQSLLPEVGVVALSSTLATNSVVEGRGGRVALICMGGDYNSDLPADYSVRIRGSHDYFGDEDQPLDEEAAVAFLEKVRGRIDGLAVSGFLSVRNPEHEVRVKELAKGIVDVPVVCGHALSGSLGFSERATTCIMNARLIPVIDELIVSVERVLGEKGIRAPLMMFRGDGSMMGSDVARERPVETILSGPAASLMGAVHMAGLRDAVVMDMGGTTTDIGVLRDGRPHLEPEGAVIGGMRTRVRAAQIATSGMGGDSRIAVSQASIVLTPLRVMPLCVAATMWPNVRSYLAAIRDFPPRRAVKKLNVNNTAYRIEFFRTLRMPGDPGSVSGADMELLELLSKGPKNLPSAAMALGRSENEFDIPGLESKGLLQRIGLTPTDVLHARGTFDRFDRDAAMAGVEYMAGMCGLTPEAFVEDACERIRVKLAFELVKVLLSDGTGEVDLGESGMDLVMRSISSTPGSVYRGRILLDRPIVGIGAPSGVYIRWMGEVFGTEVIVNEDADVGNAIGAVTASVAETVEVTIRPMVKFKGDRRVEAFSRMGRFLYGDMDKALEAQTAMAERFAAEAVERSHAEDVAVTSEHDRHKFLTVPGMRDLEEIVLRVTAAGKPRQFR